MASSLICKSQPPKARKRINVGLPANKQAGTVDCSIIMSTCETCNEEIPVNAAGIDAHDCVKGPAVTKASSVLAKSANIAAKTAAAKAKSTEIDNKRTRKRKALGDAIELPGKAKKEKDPNEPKRPPTAFFLFMEEFRATYKKTNPNAYKGGSTLVSKEGGEKWKSMSDEAKEPFVKRGNDMKEEYQKALNTYKSSIKEPIESSITDNAEEKCDVDIESCEETAASADRSTEVEQ